MKMSEYDQNVEIWAIQFQMSREEHGRSRHEVVRPLKVTLSDIIYSSDTTIWIGWVSAYYFHANVWATTQYTLECPHERSNVWLEHSRESNRRYPDH